MSQSRITRNKNKPSPVKENNINNKKQKVNEEKKELQEITESDDDNNRIIDGAILTILLRLQDLNGDIFRTWRKYKLSVVVTQKRNQDKEFEYYVSRDAINQGLNGHDSVIGPINGYFTDIRDDQLLLNIVSEDAGVRLIYQKLYAQKEIKVEKPINADNSKTYAVLLCCECARNNVQSEQDTNMFSKYNEPVNRNNHDHFIHNNINNMSNFQNINSNTKNRKHPVKSYKELMERYNRIEERSKQLGSYTKAADEAGVGESTFYDYRKIVRFVERHGIQLTDDMPFSERGFKEKYPDKAWTDK